jgi:biopolymer transport protein ExbB
MNTTMRPISVIFLFTGFASAAVAQAPAKPGAGLPPKVPAVIATASASASEDLNRSLGKLGEVQAGIQKEKDPLNKELQAREAALRDLQEALDPLLMEVNQSELDITNLRAANKLSADENQVVSNILDEYARGFEGRLHPAEVQRYLPEIDAARKAPEVIEMPLREKFAIQVKLLETSAARLNEIIGGTRFDGQAVDAAGVVQKGKFALIGPVAVFSSPDGKTAGIAMGQTGSTNPVIRTLDPAMTPGIQQLASTGSGILPLDPSLGTAIQQFVKKHSLADTFIAGGPIMWPLLFVSILVASTALQRLWFILREKTRRRPKDVAVVLDAVERNDIDTAARVGNNSTDYVARALGYALDHADTSISDALSLSASKEIKRMKWGFMILDTGITIAPLLGLLGTVTGMMHTFSMVTGDLSGGGAITGGIAEALIATAFGLLIAMAGLIPFNYLNKMVEDAEHDLESAATRLELIVQRNGDKQLMARARSLITRETHEMASTAEAAA